ncbi:EcsC family protein [Mucilaginibacter pedocola]|uniref:ABC transporter-associated protein EcsC n=1 Tax=Mucilaginibacter pedocola TaxID=1792845 RepID=A0A1S9PC20_9SPHI|nr:EcsC family protein [Mucilaginibacter pedocola]OOQ58536.1 ABC transporter-associated protein EcsC [Mucilaginibacter pedocola]
MPSYRDQAQLQLAEWQQKMQKKPSLVNRMAKGLQDKLNNLIPEKVHKAITITIEKMVKAVLFGAKYTASEMLPADAPLQLRESHVQWQISIYQKTATVEGAVTGAGGILLGLADFPLLIVIKMKMLFNIASLYGFDVKDYKERLYILYIFQLTYSSQQHRNEVYRILQDWDNYSAGLPEDAEKFDWRTFQQEYRDYIDLAKIAQLIPVIGAAVGAIANYKLIAQLGEAAMNCYRMRVLRNS